MRIAISRSLHDAIIADCASDPARERCGLLFGRGDHLLAVTPAANVAGDPARSFGVAPDHLVAAVREMRSHGLALAGHYHSHPDGRAEPSRRDADAAAGDGGRTWLIVAGGTVTAWRFSGDGPVNGFVAVPLAIAGADT